MLSSLHDENVSIRQLHPVDSYRAWCAVSPQYLVKQQRLPGHSGMNRNHVEPYLDGGLQRQRPTAPIKQRKGGARFRGEQRGFDAAFPPT